MSIVDELIEDGLVKIVTHQYSYLPNDETICLTKGYCVEDDVHESMLAINCIRFYLSFDPVVELGKVATVTLIECIQNFEFMEKYVEWFKKNKEKLDEIKNIQYLEESELNDEAIEFLKDKVWYEKNKTVSQCLKIIDESSELCKKSLKLLNFTFRIFCFKPIFYSIVIFQICFCYFSIFNMHIYFRFKRIVFTH